MTVKLLTLLGKLVHHTKPNLTGGGNAESVELDQLLAAAKAEAATVDGALARRVEALEAKVTALMTPADPPPAQPSLPPAAPAGDSHG